MKTIIAIAIVIALALGLSLLVAFPLMWAINWLFAPTFLLAVFGTSQINFWQALVLSFVASCLFKSFSSSKGD